MAEHSYRTRVVIIGGGPAGSLLSHLLHQAGVDSVVLERRSRDYVLSRIRAGVLEHGSVRTLTEAGLGDRIAREGFVHEGVYLAYADRRMRIDFADLTGKSVTIYGQTQVQQDLYAALAEREGAIVYEAEDVALHEVAGEQPSVTYTHAGEQYRVDADWVVGCDGSHGPSRQAIPDTVARTYERVYPFGWLGILSETPPIADELVYANHERGFALCSMRNQNLSRYYVQCSLDDEPDDWSDDRFWSELTTRLPNDVAEVLVTGPSIEKSITPLRSFVSEPMRYGRLLLAGDAAHIVPPTGAKGLNLAICDVVYLARAFADLHETGSTTGLETYSDTALDRVWKAVRFSWWMTTIMHRFPDQDGFDRRLQEAELSLLEGSRFARANLADNYVGLPL